MNVVATKQWTLEEFGERFGGEHVELIDGEVRELPMPNIEHGIVSQNLSGEIWTYLRSNRIGRLSGHDAFVKVLDNPPKVRGADICFFSYERLPLGTKLTGVIDNVPELVVEIVSPTDRDDAIAEKVDDYLRAGVVTVAYIDPEQRSAKIYRTGELDVTLDNGDDLEFPDILPGFRVKLASLFE